MNRFFSRLILIIGLFLVLPSTSHAQSASDSYNKGVALMNKGDYKGAIASFKASMAINKSAANTKKCKAMITKCNRLAKRKTNTEAPKPTPSKTLTLKAYHLNFEAGPEETKIVGVETIPQSSDWVANVASEHESWCKLSKSMDGKELQITCLANNSTLSRTTGITVIYDQVTRFIQLVQKGMRPQISATKTDVRINKRRGGSQTVGIRCVSDTTYSDNKNWELVKYPDWCNVQTTGSELTIRAEKLTKNDPDWKNGRSGLIIIRSQNEDCAITVNLK